MAIENTGSRAPNLGRSLKVLAKKEKFKRCGESVLHHQGKLTVLGVLLFGGTSVGLWLAQYYFPEMDKVSNWNSRVEEYSAQYDTDHCPGEAWWYHPEVDISCFVGGDGGGEIPEPHRLLSRDDYCMAARNQGCHSEFAEEKIEQLSASCLSVMNNLCSTLRDLDGSHFRKTISIIGLVFLPCIISITWVICMNKIGRKLGALTVEEAKEIEHILVDRGVDEEVKPEQYRDRLIGLALEDGLSAELRAVFREVLPSSIMNIIFDYAVGRSHLPGAGARSVIRQDWDRTKALKVCVPERQSYFYRLFKEVQEDGPQEYRTSSGKLKYHQRDDLNAQAVYRRIMNFI